jgi:hypothetical protein
MRRGRAPRKPSGRKTVVPTASRWSKLAFRMLRTATMGVVLALVAVGGASAEVVAHGVQDGILALNAKGTPSVAFIRGSTLVIASRSAPKRWTQVKAAGVSPGSNVMAFRIGAAGPVVLVQSADARAILLVRRRSVGWQTIDVAGKLPPQVQLGWPGLTLDRRGLPVIGYTRWNSSTMNSRLLLARVDAKGRVNARSITSEGFPKSLVPPPAAPVLFGGRAHVIESYGYRGVLGTFEWVPQKRTWIGIGLDAGVGDFPVGPVFAGLTPGGVLHAAWTVSLAFIGDAPVTLVERRRFASSEFVLDRALTTGLALPATGPEVAANEWVGPEDLGLAASDYLWAGAIVHGRTHVQVDGWLGGLALAPRGARDLLLGGKAGLRWFRSPRRLVTRVTLEASDNGDSIALSGTVLGVAGGDVTIYRERPGQRRRPIGRAALSGGVFSFVDRPSVRPLLYRAVYTDAATGIPYAALLRQPVG